MQRKIGAYLRVSTDEQANAIEGSLDNQRYRAKSYVDLKNTQEKGWGDIVEFYVDDGYSAKDTNRPAYQRMMTDLKKKKIDFILVSDLSRLSRNLNDFCDLLGFLDKQKSNFLSIKEQFDTSTSVGRLMVYLVITLAQFEREQTSERVALGVYARGMRGLMNGTKPILGFDKDPNKPGVYVVNKDEAPLVRRIFQEYLNCGSRAKTIERLKELNIKPKIYKHFVRQKQNGEWTVDMLGALLSNAAYIGYHEVNKGNKNASQDSLRPNQRYVRVKANWPALVPEDLFDEVQDQLEAAKSLERQRLKDAESRLYILSGVFKCAECGGSLVGQTYHGHSAKYRYYGHTTTGAKNGCKIQRVSADQVESVVLKHLKQSLTQTGYFEQLKERIQECSRKSASENMEEVARVRSELRELEQETTNIFRIQSQGDFGTEALKLMSERLDGIAKKKSSLSAHLAQMEQQVEESADAAQSAGYIQQKFVDFEHGFRKATAGQKKRLVQKTIKQIALKRDELALWFFMDESDEVPGRKLRLVRDEVAAGGLALTANPVSKLSVGSLDIEGDGDHGKDRTCDLVFRKHLLYPTELRGHRTPNF